MHARYLSSFIENDLKKKMVFLSGPRQVGKTTLALNLLGEEKSPDNNPAYLNWDAPGVSKQLLSGKIPTNQSLLVFDEIHKYRKWRNLIKGIYDTRSKNLRILVTGSAKLDLYRRGGDSLQGRYFHYRLHPFSIRELSTNPTKSDLQKLLEFGGYPEPFFSGSKTHWRRWQKDHLQKIVREEVRDLELVRELGQMELLAEALPERVGSPLSIKGLKEDLQVDHSTARRWIEILESLFYCFRIPPYGAPRIRAVKKEQKLYLWDWSLLEDKGIRFENLVASHLLKYCHFREDTAGFKMELRYIRDTDKREVDFVVLQNNKALFAVEAKLNDKDISKSIRYFKERTKIPKWYQVHLSDKSWEKDGIKSLNFIDFCKEIKIP